MTVDGHEFDSQAEAARYGELKLLLRAKQIHSLTVHPVYRLEVNGMLICKYEADFAYLETGGTGIVLEDCKGVRTPVYSLKAKLLKALHGITVTEIRRNGK